MTRCSGCGEPLPKEGEACPVCNMLNLPDAQIFAPSTDAAPVVISGKGKEQDDVSQNTGPILGAGDSARPKGETVRITKPVLPANKTGTAMENADAPVLKTGEDAYQRLYAEAAQIYGSDAYNIKRIEELRRNNVPIVLFLGMRTTGKTWLIQRMKHMLDRQYDCHPAVKLSHRAIESEAISAADEAEQRKKYLGRTDLSRAELRALDERRAAGDSGRTSAMIFHEFEPITAGEGNEFVLVDVPGEDFRLLADGQYSAIRSLACALKYASTVIVALPSDITLLGARVSASEFDAVGDVDSVRADHDFVQKLTGSLADMSKMRSILISKNVAVEWKSEDGDVDAYDREITAEALRAHTWKTGRQPFGGEDGMSCPVYIALTKADKFFAASKKLPDLRKAPDDFAAKLKNANENLRKASDGPLFAQLYQSSALNLKSLLEKPGWLHDALTVLKGKKMHVAPISNPPEMLLQANDGLFNRLNANFPMSRMDLVAAFYGHTGNTLCLADLEDYPEVGVRQMTDWLAKVHDDGITSYHGWARSAFARIYRADEQVTGPTGGARKKTHNWRLRFIPSFVLAGMFRKELHLFQAMPYLIFGLAALATISMSFSWLEQTGKIGETALYAAFKDEVVAAESLVKGQGDSTQVAALAALPVLSDATQRLKRDGKIGVAYSAALWDPVAEIASWSTEGEITPPKPIPAEIAAPTAKASAKNIREAEREIAEIRSAQRAWQSRYICGLEGWGEYRDIIRKAALNGYGNCSSISTLAMRSPVVDGMQRLLGWPVGLICGLALLIALCALVYALGHYAFWFFKTRKAYGWLYHSGVATTQREGPNPDETRDE